MAQSLGRTFIHYRYVCIKFGIKLSGRFRVRRDGEIRLAADDHLVPTHVNHAVPTTTVLASNVFYVSSNKEMVLLRKSIGITLVQARDAWLVTVTVRAQYSSIRSASTQILYTLVIPSHIIAHL